MQQTVLIGLGGTGGRIVNNVVKTLKEKKVSINDGIVTCAVLDTNKNDNDNLIGTGSGVPVIPTCDSRIIDDYLRLYAGSDPLEWFPYSVRFGQDSMIAGASEVRVKSRLAFMDTIRSNKIDKLKTVLEKVFHSRNGKPERIKIMLVSSLSGGTGSGMFIQTALWLRKFFQDRECLTTIRGILVLPDIFTETVDNIQENADKVIVHNANAYAAIRELNAINKVIKGKYKPERPIVIDDLFDSDNPCATPVFDNAFLIDYKDKQGVSFGSIGAYEEMIAQIIYMQLYAPMVSEIESVEDNLFRSFERNPEPVFGSSGTARAEYPVASVTEYCALRAAQDSIKDGWNRIDSEIDGIIQDRKDAEKDGFYSDTPIDRRELFIQLFDEKTKKQGDQVGREDRIFVAIKKDVVNESRKLTGKGNETTPSETSKVDVFLTRLDKTIIDTVKNYGGINSLASLVADLPDRTDVNQPAGAGKRAPLKVTDDLKNTLRSLPEIERAVISSVLNSFDSKSRDLASRIIRAVAPLDMGSINKNDESSIFGMFQKSDADGYKYFVHPIAAKYLLYKLSSQIARRQKNLAVEDRRSKAMAGSKNVDFDNPDTRIPEDFETYWEDVTKISSHGGKIITRSEIQNFINAYYRYNEDNRELCKQYETELLKQLVYKVLKEYVDKLIAVIEELFKKFSEIEKKISKDIEENVKKTENDKKKILYVYAKRAHKERMYKDLDIDLTGRNNDLYRDLVEAVYGKFCAEKRPNAKGNLEYAEMSVSRNFRIALTKSFRDLINSEDQYREKIDLNIIEAIHLQSDYDYALSGAGQNSDSDDIDEKEYADVRHSRAVEDYKENLRFKAAPFLMAQPDARLASSIPGVSNEDGQYWMRLANSKKGKILVNSQTELTFWGFHPEVVDQYPELEETLGTNRMTAQSDGYGKNELLCYSSIYGVIAEAIDNFNEQKGGACFAYYAGVIDRMLANHCETETPHIDKTWHEFLPYVSSTMETSSEQVFANTFWRAMAFGHINLDKDGYYRILVPHNDSYGEVTERLKYLTVNGKKIKATEVSRLITALKEFPSFELEMAERLEALYEEDKMDVETYIGTRFIGGLMTIKDHNPATILTRYTLSREVDLELRDNLATALRRLLREYAAKYDKNRDDYHIDEAKTKLLYKIYELCPMANKTVLLQNWGPDFKRFKLIAEDTYFEGDTEEVEDII